MLVSGSVDTTNDVPWKSEWWQLKTFFGTFTPKLWEDEPHFDEHIFQMGWFNHQLEIASCVIESSPLEVNSPPTIHGSEGQAVWSTAGHLWLR